MGRTRGRPAPWALTAACCPATAWLSPSPETTKRSTSGALHLDRCPLVLFALPRVNERARAMCDVAVRVRSHRGRRTATRRESLATVGAKMDAEGWHEVLLLSMGATAAPEADDWPRGAKWPRE